MVGAANTRGCCQPGWHSRLHTRTFALLSLASDHCHCARHHQGPCVTCSCFLSLAPQLLGPSSSGFGSTLSFLPLGLGRVILAATHQFLFVPAKHYCLDIIISEITCHCLDRGRVGALQLRGSIMFIDTSCIMVHVINQLMSLLISASAEYGSAVILYMITVDTCNHMTF